MKATARMCVLLCVLAGFVSILSGQPLVATESDGLTIGDLVAKMPRRAADGLRKKVIGLDSADSALLIPAAGSVAGSGGTYFRSDVTLINHRSVQQTVAIGWIAQGVDNSASPVQYFPLNANSPYILNDFIAQTLHKSGLGAVLITGVTGPNHDFDSNAQLSAFSRIWTPQPNATGTVSQGFPSVSIIDSLGSGVAYAAGLRHDSAYRANAGIVNLDSVSHTWTVGVNGLIHSGNLTPVTVLPYSMVQVPLGSGTYGDCLLSFQTTGSGFWWSAYGAAVDNITGDGWSSHALQP
jgi:hypothetical protein